MADEKVIIELDLVLDDGTVKKAIGKIPKEVRKAKKEIDESLSSSVGGGFDKALSGLSGQIKTFAAIAVGAFAFDKIIDGALRQEDAINKLSSALKRTGSFTKETASDLQSYALELQNVTRFGSGTVLEQLALSQALGATADQSKKVVSVAADLSAALGVDLGSATKSLTKTFAGSTGELGKFFPELSRLTSEQLKSGEAIRILGDRFKGFAEGDVKTASGQIQQMKNAVSGLASEIGNLFTKTSSGEASGFFDFVKTSADFYAKILKQRREDGQRTLEKIVADQKAAREAILADEEKLKSGKVSKFGGFLNRGGSVESESELRDRIERNKKILERYGVEKLELEGRQAQEEANQRIARQETERARVEQSKADALESLRSLGLTQLLDEETIFTQRITALTDFLEQRRITEEQYENLRKQAEEQYTQFLKKQEGDRVKNSFDANRALGSIVANQTQTLVKNLLAGEKASDSFKNFILGSFGELATQMGSFFIATGIAQLKLFSLDPTGTIAAGVGLVALGQILSSFQSKGLTGGASTSTASGTTPFSNDNVTSQIQSEPIEPETKVVVNVQGNILDSQESGSYIIDAINKAVDGTGATLRRNAIA